MQITATQGGSTANGLALRIFVLTQAKPAASQTGATASASTSGGGNTNITTTQTGSRVYGASIGNNVSATPTAATTQVDNIADAVNGEQYCTWKATSLTGTPGSVSLGDTNSTYTGCAMLEVLTAGTLTEDASAPAVASTTSATTVTTASFTPPPGSLLVALVSSDGGASVTTMTVSGGGLSWSEKAKGNASGLDYAGVWIADVPAPASTPQATQVLHLAKRYPAGLTQTRSAPSTPCLISITPKLSGNGAAAASFTTASWTPNTNAQYLLTIAAYAASGSVDPPQPAVTGNNVMWTLLAFTQPDVSGTDRQGHWLFAASGAGGATGAITISFSTTTPKGSWCLDEVTGADPGLARGILPQPPQTAVGAAVSSISVTMLPLQPRSVTYGSLGWETATSGAATAGFGYSLLSSDNVQSFDSSWTEWASAGTTTISFNMNPAGNREGIIGIEIPVPGPATAPAGSLPDLATAFIHQRPPVQRFRAVFAGIITRTVNAITSGLNGEPQPPATVPLSRRYPARAVIRGLAVAPLLATAVVGGNVHQRAASQHPRAVIAGTVTRTVNAAAPVPGGNLPGGLIVQRTPGQRPRIVWRSQSTPQPHLPGTVQPRATIQPRRYPSRAFWDGQSTPQPHILGSAQPRATVQLPRRYPSRAIWHSQSTPQPHVPGEQPGSGWVSRRRPARAFVAFTPVRTANSTVFQAGTAPDHLVIGRRQPARAFVAFTPVRTVNAGPPSGQVQPRATIQPRRYPARGFWDSQATQQPHIPGRIQPRATVQLPRRYPSRAVWDSGAVPLRAAGQAQPRATVPISRRYPSRALWHAGSGPAPGVAVEAPQLLPPVPRRRPSRAYVRFTPVRGTNTLFPPSAPVLPAFVKIAPAGAGATSLTQVRDARTTVIRGTAQRVAIAVAGSSIAVTIAPAGGGRTVVVAAKTGTSIVVTFYPQVPRTFPRGLT